jgi:uncharacterized NAD(P)/FAD-binding protein YdhS
LSAIDALMTVATAHGAFYLDPARQLQYLPSAHTDAFHASLMSRKGVLPEADFYCDYPYRPLQFCTVEAIDAAIEIGSSHLLDRAFELFRQELTAADPEYVQAIGLSLLTADTFSNAYFAAREASDPFVWAASNLAEAEDNKAYERTVEWRYAILRMHEVIARAVPLLDKTDLERFHKHLKTMFVDDYATVPHQSIQRILALRRAGKLDVLTLGTKYKLHTEGVDRGAVLECGGARKVFGAFIDATGQSAMSARDIPFPSLIEQGVVKAATTTTATLIDGEEDENFARTGGLDLDRAFRPIFEENLCNNLYCTAISFLLHKLPFVQGLTSAKEMGDIVSSAIRDKRPVTATAIILESA